MIRLTSIAIKAMGVCLGIRNTLEHIRATPQDGIKPPRRANKGRGQAVRISLANPKDKRKKDTKYI